MTKEQTYWTNTNGERHIATGTDLEDILASIAESEAKTKEGVLLPAFHCNYCSTDIYFVFWGCGSSNL